VCDHLRAGSQAWHIFPHEQRSTGLAAVWVKVIEQLKHADENHAATTEAGLFWKKSFLKKPPRAKLQPGGVGCDRRGESKGLGEEGMQPGGVGCDRRGESEGLGEEGKVWFYFALVGIVIVFPQTL
jgi:hypothetical protein